MSYYKPYYKDNFGMLQELPLDATTLGGQPPSSYVKTNNIKTINGVSLLGTGDLTGFIKNNDNKPTESLSLQYSSINLYTKNYLSMISLSEYSAYIGNSSSTKGSASITFSDGKVNIYAQNGVDINGTSLNDTIQNITEIAEGKTKTYVCSVQKSGEVFNTQEDSISYSGNTITDSFGNVINTADLRVGDILLFTDQDIPDRWVSYNILVSGTRYVTLVKLETRKINLEDYATNTDVDNKIAAAITGGGDASFVNVGIIPNTIVGDTESIIVGLSEIVFRAYEQNYATHVKGVSDDGCDPFIAILDWSCTEGTFIGATAKFRFYFEVPYEDEQGAIRPGRIDLIDEYADYLKNDDIKPEGYFNAQYSSFNFYTKDYISDLYVSENGVNMFNNTNGYSSIYLGGGNINIYSDNDVTINSKSFNKLYEDVAFLKGDYSLLRPSSGTAYRYAVDSRMGKYAMISQIGGYSKQSTNMFVCNEYKTFTQNGGTFTVENGTITINGTFTTATEVTISNEITACLVGGNPGDGAQIPSYIFNIHTSNTDIYWRVTFSTNPNVMCTNSKISTTQQFTNTRMCYSLNIAVNATTYNNVKLRPMIAEYNYSPNTDIYEQGFIGCNKTEVYEILHTSANIFDEVWESGTITTEGIDQINTSCLRSGYIPVNAGESYTVTRNIVKNQKIRFYDSAKTFVGTGGYSGTSALEFTYTIPEGAKYMRLAIDTPNNPGTYMVSMGTVSQPYERYEVYQTIPLNDFMSSSDTYPSYGLNLDESTYNYIDFNRDAYHINVIELDLSTLTWQHIDDLGNGGYYKASLNATGYPILNSAHFYTTPYFVTNGYTKTVFNMLRMHMGDCLVALDGENNLCVYNSVYTSGIYGFTDYLSSANVKIVYVLSKPIDILIPNYNTIIDSSKGGLLVFNSTTNNPVPYTIDYVKVE